MASLPVPTDSNFDIEAQRAISQQPPMTLEQDLQVEDMKESETHGMTTIRPGQSETKSNASQGSPPMSTGDQNSVVRPTEQSVISEDEGMQPLGVNISNDGGNNDITIQGQDQIQTEAQTELEREINKIIERHAIDPPPEEPQDLVEHHMIGDFEASANALWTIYGKEAKSHDEARIHTLKDDMDGVLIFAGLFSASLTAFVIDSKQNLKPNPSDQMVYYLQQNVAMLNQISHQVSSIAPQVSIPSTPLPPFPAFNPLASDIWVNVFWFMALIFSLSAALLAILVQQWVRDYMQAFQRYGNPLKSARLRQYLQEGSERWYMPVIAEAVPGLLHVSLFLFFAGLGDSVLNINTAVGVSTTVPIGITASVYIFTMIAPIIYPQSPYQNSFSGLIWYLIQKLLGRKYRDRDSNGALKSLSSNMAEGQMQLAMEETEARKGRDERAIRWLVGNMTEDPEMELFAMAIPGTFNGEWGLEVWKNIGDGRRRGHHEPVVGTAAPHALDSRLDSARDDIQVDDVVHELSTRIRHLLETCNNRRLFASDELWRQRTRACIGTTASLVSCANAKLDWFGDITRLLENIGADQKIPELSSEGKDQSFVMHWTCLSLVALRSALERGSYVQYRAKMILDLPGIKVYHGREQSQMIESFEKARRCLETFYEKIRYEGNASREQVERILHLHEAEISELERINTEADSSLRSVDWRIWKLVGSLPIIACQLPGVNLYELSAFDDIDDQAVVAEWRKKYFEYPIIRPGRIIKSICSFASTFRNILQGDWDPDVYQKTLRNLGVLVRSEWRQNPLQRMLWRLQDLRDGGGLGFIVELFFLSLKTLLSTYSSERSHSALYIGTFRALTSDWNKYKYSPGTQKLLLDMITPDRDGLLIVHRYPTYILDEFLVLLGNVFAGQGGPYIDHTVQQLVNHYDGALIYGKNAFVAKALEVLTRAGRAPPS